MRPIRALQMPAAGTSQSAPSSHLHEDTPDLAPMPQPQPKPSPPPPTPQEIAALVRRAADGDVAAFERLVGHYHGRVLNFALAFTADRDQAADLAQEAFIKAYRSIGGFRFESSFSTWLFRIVKNAFLDAVKSRQARERELETPIEDELGHLQTAALAEEQVMRAEARRDLRRAMKRVPTAYRMVVVLFDVQGLSYDEIAKVLDIPIGTVKSRLKRGRDALREEIFRTRAREEEA